MMDRNRGFAGQGRPGYGGHPGQPPFQPPSPAQLKAIIEQGDARELVKSAETVGSALAASRLTTSQIRGIFATVRQIQMKWPPGEPCAKEPMRQLLLLKPKLAYQARRSGQGVENLKQVLVPAIDMVANREQFGRFVDYFEAILAYHRAAGGE